MSTNSRHVPYRKCIACARKEVKNNLLRVVVSPQKLLQLDINGNLPGRGAYFCKDKGCFNEFFPKDRLEYSLRTKIGPEDWEHMVSEVNCFSVY
tara:strand:- start:356 stop:637 length:282 start_codon:yes stop_codon:yes gene_type:complete